MNNTDKNKTKRLFSDFPPVTTQEWKDKITKDLKGADYDRKLVWRTKEGFNLQPFYRSEDIETIPALDQKPGEFPFRRGVKGDNNWLIRQDIIVKNPAEANKKALDVISKGVTSLGLVFIQDIGYDAFTQLLSGIDITSIEVVMLIHGQPLPFITHLINYCDDHQIDKTAVKGHINYAPLTAMIICGQPLKEEAFGVAKELIMLSEQLPNYRTYAVPALFYHNSGATITQELAFALAEGAEAMSLLIEKGVDAQIAAQNIMFSFAIGGDYFKEIAKLRAARVLWALILHSFGVVKEECKMALHTESSSWNLTVYDPYVNMLRTTTEAMTAAIGGADSHKVLPFDSAWKSGDVFAERIARNQQHILKLESHFDKVTDPGAGSYYIETVTDKIIDAAWKLFLEVEEKGGFRRATEQGFIQQIVEETAQKRDMNVALRKESLLGINQFPNFTEHLDKEISLEKSTFSCCEKSSPIKHLHPYRGAWAFEKMRSVTDAYAEKNKRPKVFMLTIGNLAMRKARAQFGSNFFACAGFEVKDNNGFSTIKEGVNSARAYGADVIVLCSSDQEYETYAAELINEVKEEIVVIAGYPKAIMEQLKEIGVEHFIHVKSNVLEMLTQFQALLGISL